MKKHLLTSFSFVFVALLLLFTGCQAFQEGRSNELEYDTLMVSGQQETPPGENQALEDAQVDSSGRPSLFARVFGQRNADSEPTPTPVQAPQADAGGTPPPVAQPVGVADEDTMATHRLISGEPIVVVLSGTTMDDRVEATIDERGFIKLRYIGSVRAAGRTPTELAREIEAEYTDRQEIYREIYVTVHVPNRFYFIGGEIRQPGRYPLVGRVSLSQAIVAAGNFTEWARNDGRLTLLRDNERTTIHFRDITNDPNLDIELRTGDVITVDRRGF